MHRTIAIAAASTATLVLSVFVHVGLHRLLSPLPDAAHSALHVVLWPALGFAGLGVYRSVTRLLQTERRLHHP